MVGERVELVARRQLAREMSPYERLLGDAIAGDGALFTRDDSVEAAWRVVEPVISGVRGVHLEPPAPYQPGTWGPPAAAKIVAAREGWHDPQPEANAPC